MKALVLGGTRYFGRHLVRMLVEAGDSVTVATRGKLEVPDKDRTRHRVLERTDAKSLAALAKEADWDLVFDQICYSPDEAAGACQAFEGRVGRFVHTSTASVYLREGVRSEKDFDPFIYPLRSGSREDFDYGEGKRLAEAVYFQKARFEVAAMRIPVVLGPDDYTGRLEFHVDRIRDGKPLVVPNPEAEISFIRSTEAARFLLWLGKGSVTGPLNACSDGAISIGALLALIRKAFSEQGAERSPRIASEGPDSDATPFAGLNSLLLDTSKARSLGFEFEALEGWLPELVAKLVRDRLKVL